MLLSSTKKAAAALKISPITLGHDITVILRLSDDHLQKYADELGVTVDKIRQLIRKR